MTTTDLARVSALLDGAKEDLSSAAAHLRTMPELAIAARCNAKIDEAQRLLVGDKPTRAEDN